MVPDSMNARTKAATSHGSSKDAYFCFADLVLPGRVRHSAKQEGKEWRRNRYTLGNRNIGTYFW